MSNHTHDNHIMWRNNESKVVHASFLSMLADTRSTMILNITECSKDNKEAQLQKQGKHERRL
eukprot:XP_001697264.1 predicted protein [Chlamydomonas reinhardtii]